MVTVKVLNYNVLSSHLASPDHFSSCDPEYLDKDFRLESLIGLLDKTITQTSESLLISSQAYPGNILEQSHASVGDIDLSLSNVSVAKENSFVLSPFTSKQTDIGHTDADSSPIICFQEVSQVWAGKLHSYFANKGYYMVTGLYGKRFNGYMGVAIAVPLNKYEIIDVDVQNVSDTKIKRCNKNENNSLINIAIKSIQNIFRGAFTLILRVLFLQEEKTWSIALSRFNQLVSIRLQSYESPSKPFVIGTYHMPCIYDKVKVMMVHTALSLQYLQKRAGNDPLIYCGDFNFKPDSPMYQLVTKGTIDDKSSIPESHYPNDNWNISKSTPMHSAYYLKNNREPDFTNFAKVRDDPVFIDTIDYIFLSNHWIVEKVRELPSKEDIFRRGWKSLPNKEELSDHLMLSAEMKLT